MKNKRSQTVENDSFDFDVIIFVNFLLDDEVSIHFFARHGIDFDSLHVRNIHTFSICKVCGNIQQT